MKFKIVQVVADSWLPFLSWSDIFDGMIVKLGEGNFYCHPKKKEKREKKFPSKTVLVPLHVHVHLLYIVERESWWAEILRDKNLDMKMYLN